MTAAGTTVELLGALLMFAESSGSDNVERWFGSFKGIKSFFESDFNRSTLTDHSTFVLLAAFLSCVIAAALDSVYHVHIAGFPLAIALIATLFALAGLTMKVFTWSLNYVKVHLAIKKPLWLGLAFLVVGFALQFAAILTSG